jgi:dTDP-4-dehydrorhamnose 3,5-epimerase
LKYIQTQLIDAWLIQLEPKTDERGFFARAFCEEEFKHRQLCYQFVQCNLSFNHEKGTLRGMHYQAEPHSEVKLVRCVQGAIFDVIVDMRPDSKTYLQWQSFELSSENRNALYIPEGFAHGYQTLYDKTEVFYQVSAFYQPQAGRGVRWNDPLLKIVWPLSEPVVSEQDQKWPYL